MIERTTERLATKHTLSITTYALPRKTRAGRFYDVLHTRKAFVFDAIVNGESRGNENTEIAI